MEMCLRARVVGAVRQIIRGLDLETDFSGGKASFWSPTLQRFQAGAHHLLLRRIKNYFFSPLIETVVVAVDSRRSQTILPCVKCERETTKIPFGRHCCSVFKRTARRISF